MSSTDSFMLFIGVFIAISYLCIYKYVMSLHETVKVLFDGYQCNFNFIMEVLKLHKDAFNLHVELREKVDALEEIINSTKKQKGEE